MLVLTRKSGESITINDKIRIYVVEIRHNQVKLGIEAPPNIAIFRTELLEKIRQENVQAISIEKATLQDLVNKIGRNKKKDNENNHGTN